MKQEEGHPLNILFWDIDGTLLHTNHAGLHAFHQATKDLLGTEVEFNSVKTAGMTDYYIADQIIRSATGQEPAHRDIVQLIKRYVELLPGYLETHQGALMPSVADLLSSLHDHPSFISTLLTGNNAAGAKIKLSHFNIAHFFDFTLGAFSFNCRSRRDVAAHAKQIVEDRHPDLTFERVFVIGDTPHDIDCGKFIGAQTIAVATGSHSFQDLVVHSPWWTLETLPSAEEFIEKIGSKNY